MEKVFKLLLLLLEMLEWLIRLDCKSNVRRTSKVQILFSPNILFIITLNIYLLLYIILYRLLYFRCINNLVFLHLKYNNLIYNNSLINIILYKSLYFRCINNMVFMCLKYNLHFYRRKFVKMYSNYFVCFSFVFNFLVFAKKWF